MHYFFLKVITVIYSLGKIISPIFKPLFVLKLKKLTLIKRVNKYMLHTET